MGSKNQRRLAVLAQPEEALDAAGVVVDKCPVPRVALGQPIDMRKLDRDAPEIIPDAA